METKATIIGRHDPARQPGEGLPLYLSSIRAGFPSPAEDQVERNLDLHERLVRDKAATFFLRAVGDSMRDAGILNGDLLVVDRSLEAAHGRIIIAALDGRRRPERRIRQIRQTRQAGRRLRAGGSGPRTLRPVS